MGRCPDCGSDVKSGSSFCPNCSHSFSGLPRPRAPTRGRTRGVALVVVGVTLAGLVAFPVLLFSFFPLPPGVLQQPAVNSVWVGEYMAAVNAARVANGSASMQLNQSLSSFAQVRFQNASLHYDILNYGFHEDLAKAFANTTVIDERVGFVYNMTASQYVNFTRSNGDWNGLLQSKYDQYGYYVGTANYYSVNNRCDESGRPSEVTNETAFLLSRGCSYSLVPYYWLVLELNVGNPAGGISSLINRGQTVVIENAKITTNSSAAGQPGPELSFSFTDANLSGLDNLTVSLTPILSSGFVNFSGIVTVTCKFDHHFDAANPLLPGPTVLATCTGFPPATGGTTYKMSLQGTFEDGTRFTVQDIKVQ